MNKKKYAIVLSIKMILINKYNQYINVERLIAKGEENRKFSF